MKKSIYLLPILAILLCAVSCQDNGLDNGRTINDGKLKLTANIVSPEDTRVSYDVDNSAHTVTPAWSVGDELFGFDDAGQTFTFTVESLSGSSATLNDGGYTPGTATKLYAIYYPGKTVSDLEGDGAARTLAIDLTAQDGILDETSPVLMCATAAITAGSATLNFTNQTAIVGVTKFKVEAAAEITRLNLAGLKARGRFTVSGDELVLEATGEPSTLGIDGSWTADGDGVVATALYFASLPTPAANIRLDATSATTTYSNVSAIASTSIEAGNYYYMTKILAAQAAAIGSTTYATINDAWTAANAATSDVTVTLLNDCAAASALVLNNSASGTGAITLDLNGKTLTASNQIQVNNGRSLTVTDNSSDLLASQGKISVTSGAKTHCIKVNGSDFTLLGGTLENANIATDSCYTLQITTSGDAVAHGTLTHGKITSTYRGILTSTAKSHLNMDGDTEMNTELHAMYINGPATVGGTTSITTNNANAIVLNSSGADLTMQDNVTVTPKNAKIVFYQYFGNLTVTGGTYTNGNNMFYVYGNGTCTTNISGGTFTSTTTGALVYVRNSNCTVTISGGAFKGNTCSNIINAAGTTRVYGGVFCRAILKAVAKDGDDNPYVNVLNDDPATKENYPFTVSPASSTPEVAYTLQTGNTDTLSHGSLQSAALGLNKLTSAQDMHLSSDVTTTSRVTLECPGTVNLYLDDHVITTNVARAVLVRTDVNIYDGPGHTGGITNTTANHAVMDSTANTTLSIYGGTFKGGATYGAIRVWGNGVTLNVSGEHTALVNTGSGAAVNIGGTNNETVSANISGGTFQAGTGVALRCGHGTTLVTGGTFLSNTTAAATVNSAKLTIRGGYFHTGESASDIITAGGTSVVSVSSGWFSKAVTPALIATNYIDESGSTTVGGKTYTHQVVLDPLAVVVASVNDTDYFSFNEAVAAAKEYDGGDATVTLKLKENVENWAERIDMTNENSKPIVFDLNAHTFGVIIDSVLTTTGTLTITDGSGLGTGKYSSNGRKQIYLFGSGTVNINHCTIECTRPVFRNTGATYSAIAIAGSSGAKAGTVNVSEGAKVYTTTGFKPFYVGYGNLNFSSNCEITSGTEAEGGYYCIYESTGGIITINGTPSFRSFDHTSGTKYGIIRSGTGNSASKITINGGYFYGGTVFNRGDDASYAKPFTVSGGYFSFDFRENFAQATIGTWHDDTASPTAHSHGGESLNYNYHVGD